MLPSRPAPRPIRPAVRRALLAALVLPGALGACTGLRRTLVDVTLEIDEQRADAHERVFQ